MHTNYGRRLNEHFINSGFKVHNYLLVLLLVISSSNQLASAAGRLDVTVVNTGTGGVLSGIEVHAMERLSNGEDQWRDSGVSNGRGSLVFDLPGLGEGKIYYFMAVSPIDGQWRTSADLKQSGQFRFNLVHSQVNVQLVNGVSNQPLTKQTIHVMAKENDGAMSWVSQGITDSTGRVTFDLDLQSNIDYVMVTEPYNGGWVTSPAITKSGAFLFRVGTFEVTVINAADNSVLSGIEVHAMERLADGTDQWRASGTSDANGVIQFDLPGLGTGGRYILQGLSPVDGTWKTSPELTQSGRYSFALSNAPLIVTLVNGITNQALVNQEIHVMKRQSDASLTWVATATTGNKGKAVFDIADLGSGSDFVLLTEPYNGGQVISPSISKPGEFLFQVGTLPVTVINGDLGKPLANRLLTIIRKNNDGSLMGLKSGVSDANGKVHFDIPEFEKGGFFTVHGKSLDNQKDVFSPWITNKGPMTFNITDTGNFVLDSIAPNLMITSPRQGATVSSSGFTIKGTASDDQELNRIEVHIKDPVIGASVTNARYDNGSWAYTVPGSMVSNSAQVSVIIKAFDKMGNITTRNMVVNTVADIIKPKLNILSHKNGDQVIDAGFLVTGMTFDNTGIKELKATVNDPKLGTVLNQADIEVSKMFGRWGIAIKQASAGETINLALTATDFSGNSVTQNLALNVISATESTRHLVNRITFGASTEMIEDALDLGFDGFIDQQLNPESIDDSALESQLNNLVFPKTTDEWLSYLQDYQIVHAVYSKRQLLEVMTWFWENHFNTLATKTWDPNAELRENKLFRQNALGKFRDLLQISATSPAMNVYLDNVFSRKEEPNENWARELLELHTLGIKGGYSAQDIVEVARVFTGWTIDNNAFFFDKWLHDDGEKTVLGNQVFANSGFDEGMQVLDILASHPSTAQFVCKKLINLFISDTAARNAVENCAQDFLSSDGDIGFIVGNILRSAEFKKPKHFRSKVKSPFKFVTGILRSLEPEVSRTHIRWSMFLMNMPLTWNPVPTGYSEIGSDWINSEQLLQRYVFTNGIINAEPIENQSYLVNVTDFFRSKGYETAEGVTGYLFGLAMAHDYTQLEWDQAIAILTDNNTKPFDIYAEEEAEQRIRELLATVLNYPSYQLQ